ncbi:MAG: ABC transporter permease [Gemmatimonadota bacterium]
MEEVVYSADSQLRSPGRFAAELLADLRVAPSVAWHLFLRKLQAGYRQSWLGYLWLLLPPLATSGAWVYLNAARILDVGPTDLPYPVFVLTGTLLWQVFAEALEAPLKGLSAARAILTRSRVPHEAMLLAGMAEVVFNFAVRLAVVAPVLLWLGARPGATALLAPLGVAALLLLGFSLGLLLAPVGMLYQDVSRGITLVAGIWFFLTPVIYPPSASPLGALNPVAPLLVTARGWLTGGPAAPAAGSGVVVAASLAALAVGWGGYRLAKPHLVSRL